MPTPRLRTLAQALLLLLAAAALLAGCGSSGTASSAASGKLQVVAAEDFWGSIAAQLGGDRVEVTSIITNPAADPHDYEPTSEDARTMASAQMAIVNGIGYDEWAAKLLAANPVSGRVELTVGDVLGLQDGDNPHQWYSPASVHRVIAQITADYKRADPGSDSYFDRRRSAFETKGLAEYDDLIAQIKASYAGTPVGASESIFEPLAPALGLDLITPKGFMDAIAEGTEPTPADKATTDEQIAGRQLRAWVYNSQNATPDVQRLNDAAKAARVPVATVTETLTPEGASFQDWMSRQLKGLRAALARAAGELSTMSIEAGTVAPAAKHRAGDAIRLEAAAVSRGGRHVWSGVDLTIRRGEFVAVLGPNGAGKSTLLDVVLGLHRLSAGSVSVLGQPPGAAQQRIGYLPQRRSFDAGTRIRGRDVVRLGLDGARWGFPLPAALSHSGRAAAARVEEMIELVGAGAYASRSIGELSGGEQQRLLIAQALVRGPEMLLLDEPLDSLDLSNQGSVAGLVQRICEREGVTVLLVAHDVNPILGYLDRVVYFARGRGVEGAPREVIDAATLSRLYGVPTEVLETSDGRLVVVGTPEPPAHHHSRHGHGH